MFKRIMSVMLAIVMLMSVAMVAASAAQVEIADNSADAVAGVAAEGAADTGADAGAETAAANTISFDVNSAGWNNFKTVFCHVWAYDGSGDWPAWQSKKEKCTYDTATGIATYDLSKTGNSIDSGVLYAVIFSNENGMQTYNLLMGAECIGDTAYCDGTMYENPEDSSKTAQAAFWKGQDKTVYGPEKCVTSIGNVVGTCVPFTMSALDLFVGFLQNNLTNARTYAMKDDQTLIDDTAAALGLYQEDVTKGIADSEVKDIAWEASKSSLPTGTNPESESKGTNGTGGTGSTGSTGSSSSSGSGSGSGSNTKTGQETTVLFIMLGLMIAAAGAVVLSRKSRA